MRLLVAYPCLKTNCPYFHQNTCHPRKDECKAEEEEEVPPQAVKEENFGFQFRARVSGLDMF